MKILINNKYNKNINLNYEAICNSVLEKIFELENLHKNFEVSIVIVNDFEIKSMNKKFRKIDKVTDVLSFPLIDKVDLYNYTTNHIELGDIIVNFDRVVSQSADYCHSQEREFAFLIAHSTLHLLGYDHLTYEEDKIMVNKQKKILDSLNISR